MHLLTAFVNLLQFALISSSSTVSCRNENNEFVDWFYLYKLPSSCDGFCSKNTGLHYIFLSSESLSKGWQLSSHLISENTSFPGRTLSAISGRSNTLLLAYNDETPNGEVNTKEGHTKGVISADEKSGFWLIHSVPKYPDLEAPYNFPNTGVHYGQSFLCISFNASQMDIIGEQQIFNEPNVYFSRFPHELRDKYKKFEEVLNKTWKKEAPFWNDVEIISINGTNFRSFAKGHKFMKELYEDYVAPALDSDLLVESWRHGTGILPSNCTRRNRVYNISSVKITQVKSSFNSTSDHSKWAVSAQSADWICVGDINRAEHQLNRGGGTVCQVNSVVAKLYNNLIDTVEACKSFK